MKDNVVLQNRWYNLQRIGGSGFTTTYKAVDIETGKPVIIKEFSLLKAGDWKAAEKFEYEAKILKHLEHPGIPEYIDYFTEDEVRYFIVQEYAEGKALDAWISEGRRFTQEEALHIALSVAEISDYLHCFSPPVIHSDIKPHNIILDSDNKVYLIDFGAVRNNFEATVTGTFGYMAPEQMRGKTIPCSDIYSLGITLIHLLSHIPPYEMEENEMRIQFHTHVNISGAFKRVLEKMAEPLIKKRYQDMPSLISALQDVIHGKDTGESFGNKLRKVGFVIISFILLVISGIILVFMRVVGDKLPPPEPGKTFRQSAKTAPSAQSSAPEDGLVAYFPFNGDVQDKSGNGYITSAYGHTAFVPGGRGKAAEFDGRTAYISVKPTVSLPDDLTITAWINLKKNLEPNSSHTVFAIRDQCSSSWRGWTQVNLRIFRVGHADQLTYEVGKTITCNGGSGGDRYSSPETNFAQVLNQWIFIAVTVESNASEHRRVNMYINDKEVMVDMILNVPTKSAFSSSRKYKTYISSLNGRLLNFNGYIADLRIYDRVLTDAEIMKIFEG